MKKVCLVLLLIVFLFSVASSATALEIKPSKPSYLAGETFMADVNGDFAEQLTVKNIFFYKDGSEIEPAFYIIQASKQQYFVWVNLQNAGNYSFAVKNILYRENGILKGDSKDIDFEVKPSINSFYQSLIQTVESGWPSSVEENALALMALSYDDSLALKGKTALIGKGKDGECWPAAGCSVKETALAMMALDKINAAVKSEWLIDAQNNLDTGLWNLQATSAAQECKLLINAESQNLNLSEGINTIDLDLKSKPETVTVKLNCSVTSSKVVHTYLGTITEFPMQNAGSSSSITLNNKKCFGKSYRSECDAESTAYAVLALNSINAEKSNALDWLKSNAKTTKEKAIRLYLSGSSEIEDWLINNQHASGYWSNKALVESQEPDSEATVFAVQALEKEKQTAATKGEAWLKKEFDSESLKNKALMLAFIFQASGIEPILTINPPGLKTETNSTISIEVSNKGVLPVNISAELLPFKIKQSLSLKQDSSGELSFAIPTKIGRQEITNETQGSIEIDYKTSLLAADSYIIPVIITPKTAASNETAEILPSHFRFSASEINATILIGEEMLIPLELRDFSHYVIKDISITYTRDFKDILNLTPEHIDFINPGEYAGVNLTFKSGSIKNATGFIEARASSPIQLSVRIPVGITFTRNASAVNIKMNYTVQEKDNKTCKNLNGTVCKSNMICSKPVTKTSDTPRCCIDACKSSINTTKIMGILMIILAVIIVAVFIIIGLRKPKKQTKDVYEEIEKKYSKFSK